ncbi:MAG: DUF4405 domain-containing protein [Gammaproteobacteria bacterium]
MKRTQLNFVIDVIAFVGFVFLTTTGILLHYLLPPGSGHFAMLWGLDRHQWGTLHFWISVIFFSILALHLLLHWRWLANLIKGKTPEGSGLRLGLGAVGMLTLIAFAIAPLTTPVQIVSTKSDSLIPSSHPFENIEIRGSMTLIEVEQATGVPADHIIEKMGLPPSLSKDEKLGKLRRIYGFELAGVRKVVADYKN